MGGEMCESVGGVAGGGRVSATGGNTGAVYKTTSTDTGAYRIPDMQVGVYNIAIAATGFKTSEQNGLVVQINTTSSLDVTLLPRPLPHTLTPLPHVPPPHTTTSPTSTAVTERQ